MYDKPSALSEDIFQGKPNSCQAFMGRAVTRVSGCVEASYNRPSSALRGVSRRLNPELPLLVLSHGHMIF